MSTVAALPPSAVPNGVMLVIRAPARVLRVLGRRVRGNCTGDIERIPIIMDYHSDQAVVIKDGLQVRFNIHRAAGVPKEGQVRGSR